MDLQTLTLQLPEATYQRLVELATKSERPLAEETVNLLNSALDTGAERSADIANRLEQLFLFTDEELWKAATARASEIDNNSMQALLEKRQREGLTAGESTQLAALSKHFNQIMLVRAKAAVILAERGLDVSELALTS